MYINTVYTLVSLKRLFMVMLCLDSLNVEGGDVEHNFSTIVAAIAGNFRWYVSHQWLYNCLHSAVIVTYV